MTPQRIATRRLITDLYFFCVIYSVAAWGLFCLRMNRGDPALLLILLLPYLGMLAVRLRVRRIVPFFLAHLFLAFLPLALPVDPLLRLGICVVQLASLVYSIRMRLAGDWRPGVPGMVFVLILCTALSAAASRLDREGIVPWLAAFALGAVMCCLAGDQLARVDQSLAIITQTTKQPVGSILRFNNVIIGLFLGLVLLAGALSPLLPTGRLLSLLGNGLLAAIRWLASLLPSREVAVPEPVVEEPPGMDYGGLPAEEPGDTSWLMELLEQILVYAVTAALVLGVLAAIAYGIYRLYKRFYSAAPTNGDVTEFVEPEFQVERLAHSLRDALGRLPLFGRSEAERIRRTYFKRVRHHIRRGVQVRKEDTAGEIRERIRPREDLGELTARYEEIRYGK